MSGTIDESIRHAITKFSHIHFPATKIAARNILRLGESRKNIFMVGCPRIDLIKETLSSKINLKKLNDIINTHSVGGEINLIKDNFIMIMQHPVTTEFNKAGEQIQNTLEATKKINLKKIFFWPNVDAGSERISYTIRKWREDKKDKDYLFIKNLETEYFYQLMKISKCLVGNSSAGIRDAGFIGTPVVNIGTRQNDREHGNNVINSNYKKDEIYKKILITLKKKCKKNILYGDGTAAKKIIKILKNIKK